MKSAGRVLCVCALWTGSVTDVLLAVPTSTAFTYQGRLQQDGAPANGTFDLQFALFDAATGGAQIGATVCRDHIAVTDGLFTVELDFGAAAFNGEARWLEVGVRADNTADNCDTGAYATLAPRHLLTATPYAARALSAPNGHALDAADGSPTDALFVDDQGFVGIGTTTPNRPLTIQGVEPNSGAIQLRNSLGLNRWHLTMHGGGLNFAETGVADFRLYLAPGGNVGINTIGPTARLEINSGGGTGASLKCEHGGSNLIVRPLSAGGNATVIENTGSGSLLVNPSGGGVGIGTTTATSTLSVAGSADFSGSIGIGTTTPNATLDVVDGSIWVSGTTGGGLPPAAGAGIRIFNDVLTDTSLMYAYDYAAGTPRVLSLQGAGGNLGIGNLAPTNPLSVTGDADFSGSVGIGTTLPAARLNVSSNDPVGTSIRLDNPANGGNLWSFKVDGTDAGPGRYSFHLRSEYWNESRLTIDDPGNVGIGTVLPLARLHTVGGPVLSHALFESDSPYGTWLRLLNTDEIPSEWGLITTGSENTEPPGSLLIRDNMQDAVRMMIDPSGNVGIGTTSPTRPLTVQGVEPNSSAIQLRDSSGMDLWHVSMHGGGLNFAETSVADYRLYLAPGGNVGIGTFSPAVQLAVSSNDPAGTSIRLENPANASTIWSLRVDGTATPGNNYSFHIRDDYYDATRLTIGPTGNVGIGATAPGYKLTVSGASAQANVAGFLSSSPDTTVVAITNTSTGGRNFSLLSTGETSAFGAGKFVIRDVAAAGNRFTIDSSGNVGIATTTPSQRLHVVGNICATGTIGACSDARFKTNVVPLDDALSLVDKLRPVRFDWKRDEYPDHEFDDGRQMGLIAQEVKNILPEAVQEGSDGYLSVDYGRLTPLLIEAIRELRTEKERQIESLESKLAQRDRKIADLEARLGRLEAAAAR